MGKALRIAGFLILLCGSAFGQGILTQVMQSQPVVVGATPGLVNLHAGSSTGSNAMGARAASTTTCVANAYCTSLPAASVSGNTIAVFYTYTSTNTTAHAPTITDDKSGGSSTYTCVTEGNDASGTTRTFAGICYSFNVASGIRVITMTMPVATCTHGQVHAFQFYNVVTGDTLSAANGTQSANTTYTSGAITTTVNGDLICNMTVGTTTRRNLGTGFTAGSGFTLYTAQRLDAMAVECGIQSTAGSITPTMTGLSNTYVAVDISFKAGASGTAPSGMYILAEEHESTNTTTTGPYTVQFPDAGANLVYSMNQCGGSPNSLGVTGVSGTSTGTWTKTGPDTVGKASGSFSVGLGNSFFSQNVTGSATDTLTFTTNANSGDCTFVMFAYAGAATSPWTSHISECISPATDGQPCGDNTTAPPTASTFSPFADNSAVGYFPANSAGISVASMGVGSNTNISASGSELFTSDTYGGEPLNGVSPVDENNAWSNIANSDNTAQTVTYGLTSASTNIGQAWALRDSFASSTATKYPGLIQIQECKATTSGSTLTCAITATQTGHTVVYLESDGSSSAHTITTNSTSCNSDTLTQVSGNTSATVITSIGAMKAWYISSIDTTSSCSVVFTWQANNTYRTIWMVELANVASLDKSNIALKTSNGSTGAVSSNSSGTLSSAHEIVLGWNVCSGGCSLGSGMNLIMLDNVDGTSSGQSAGWFSVNATTAVTTNFVESSHGSNDGIGILTFQ